MKLSLKQKALLQTAGILVGSTMGGVFLAFVLANIPMSALPYISISLLVGGGFYLLYGVTLSRLEYNETLKKMTEKKD
jgi:hypothetical protein